MEDQASSFPVNWENPEDAQAFWYFDVTHCPEPMTWLDYDLRLRALNESSNRVQERLGMPLSFEPRLINGFVYSKVIPRDMAPEAALAAIASTDAALREIYSDLQGRWEKEWLPEVQSHTAFLAAFDVSAAPLPALLAHLAETRRRIERLWEVHNTLLFAFILALGDFDQAYRDLFPDAKPLDVYDLLAGFPNKTTEANSVLWGIGREVARSPALCALVTESPLAGLAAALAQSDEGRALLDGIEKYAAVYGERNDDLFITKPTWIDDMTPLLRGLREAALAPDRDLPSELRQQAQRRQERLAEVRAAIASHPRPVVDEFEALLEAAQAATVLSEDHHYWIDCKVTHQARRLALELGKRFVQRGVFDQVDDVFHLTVDELTALGDSEGASSRLHALIAERKAEIARFANVTPPPFLGVPRALLPPESGFIRAFAKFSGHAMAPPADESELPGMPGSGGKVVGPACVVRTLRDAERLKKGDVLVAPSTLPSWTPFFASAAAVVTNIGGMLCHAAVVAREYGLPAVVGTGRATEVIRDGQLVEVDGDAGIVRILRQ